MTARPGEPRRAERIFGRLSGAESNDLAGVLRNETIGGALMLGAAVVALVWANSPWSAGYDTIRATTVGPAALHLDLSLQTWAADGLLAVFFFVAGLELKRELVVGDLRKPSRAAVPVAAAIAGMAAPALMFLAVAMAAGGEGPALRGWAIPTATDIAFALAVLAVIQSHLPPALRAFLLTLAVVDDLGAILVIATVYTASVDFLALAGAALLLILYAVLQHRRVRAWWIYVPIGLTVWGLVHEAGVHATVAGMALALLTRARPDPGEHEGPAERVEHRVGPYSAGLAVPIFALFAAGVPISGGTLGGLVDDPASIAVVVGLVVGKPIGVLLGAWLTARFTRAELDEGLGWSDIAAVGMLAGVGFTVSLLVTELAYDDAAQVELVKTAVIIGSLIAALLAAMLLVRRNAAYRRLEEAAAEPGSDMP